MNKWGYICVSVCSCGERLPPSLFTTDKKQSRAGPQPLVSSCMGKIRIYLRHGTRLVLSSLQEPVIFMVWEKRIRSTAWVFFIIMWIPLAFLIYQAVTDGDEDSIGIAMMLFFFLCIVFTILLVGSFGIGSLEKEEIKKKGIAAKATIVSVSDTGTMINNQPQLRIELDVQPPYDSRFVTTIEYVIPCSCLPQVQPGNSVKVYYLEETKEVALADL